MTTQISERQLTSAFSGTPPASQKPAALGTRSWFGVPNRAVSESSADNVIDWAAALTYYGVLAIFPAIIAPISILGLIGPSAIQPLITNVGKLVPGCRKASGHRQ